VYAPDIREQWINVMMKVFNTEYSDEIMYKELDTYLREGFKSEVAKWKQENQKWVSTLDYFLELKWI
jgi:hypothetical protein